ncbi:hypothetical protein ACVWXN_000208 [Bradyrhizobium sp. i1.4.4]
MASPSCLGQTDRFSTRALFGHADSSQTCRGWAKQRDEYGASRAPITCVSHGHMAELRAVDRPRLLPRRSRLDAGGSASQSRLTSFSDALLCRYSCPQCWPNENERPQAGTNHLGWSRSGGQGLKGSCVCNACQVNQSCRPSVLSSGASLPQAPRAAPVGAIIPPSAPDFWQRFFCNSRGSARRRPE